MALKVEQKEETILTSVKVNARKLKEVKAKLKKNKASFTALVNASIDEYLAL